MRFSGRPHGLHPNRIQKPSHPHDQTSHRHQTHKRQGYRTRMTWETVVEQHPAKRAPVTVAPRQALCSNKWLLLSSAVRQVSDSRSTTPQVSSLPLPCGEETWLAKAESFSGRPNRRAPRLSPGAWQFGNRESVRPSAIAYSQLHLNFHDRETPPHTYSTKTHPNNTTYSALNSIYHHIIRHKNRQFPSIRLELIDFQFHEYGQDIQYTQKIEKS